MEIVCRKNQRQSLYVKQIMNDLKMAADEDRLWNEWETTIVIKMKDGLIKTLDELTMASDEDYS